jgi:hypothetical protein
VRRWIAALSLLTLLPRCETTTVQPAKGVAKCQSKEGDVRSHPASEATWNPLSIGAELASGDWVQTAERAWAGIEFFSGSKVEIEPSSVVIIEEPGEDEEKGDRGASFVSLRSGQVHGVVSSEGGGASHDVVVKTPSGKTVRISPVIGSGELDYRVAATDAGDVKLSVSKGQATVKGADGTLVKLGRGQAQDVKAGRLAGEVIARPNPPEPTGPSAGAKEPVASGGTLGLSWKPAAKSLKYRIQIAEDETFHRLALDETTDSASFPFHPTKPGTYYWRVATRDDRGNESDFSRSRTVQIVEPVANQLLGPPDNAQVSSGKGAPTITLAWRPQEPDGEYEVVVSRSPDLERDVVLRHRVKGAGALKTRDLGVGEYYWGVFWLSGGERKPMSQDARRLSVKRSASGLRLPRRLKWE